VLDPLRRVEVRLAGAERDDVDTARAQLLGLGLDGERGGRGEGLQTVGQHVGLLVGRARGPAQRSGYFSVRRFSTIVGTMPATEVPKLATSLMSRDEMYVYFSWGIRKTVSAVGRSLRFMSAIWNSYSKSDTARMPRTMQSARSRATRSMSRPSKAAMRNWVPTPTMLAVASSIISRRS